MATIGVSGSTSCGRTFQLTHFDEWRSKRFWADLRICTYRGAEWIVAHLEITLFRVTSGLVMIQPQPSL